jgi:hypothetical protein
MCVVKRDGKVVIIDQSNEIDSLVIGLENAVQAVRLSCDKIGGLRLRIMELEAQVATLKKIAEYLLATSMAESYNSQIIDGFQMSNLDFKDTKDFIYEARCRLAEEHPKLFQQIGE